MSDDEDDSMAANPEPRSDLGYVDTAAPRTRRHRGEKTGRWEIVFVEGRHDAEPVASPKRCKTCGEEAPVLHSIAPEIRRLHCGACQGASHS